MLNQGIPRGPVRGACLLAILLAAPLCPADRWATDEDVFVGYVNGSAAEVDARLYTHLCHAFVVADAQGRLKPNPQVPDREFARRAHAEGAKVLLSLGGWGWDAQFAEMVLDPAAEDRYLNDVLRLIDEADYDGVDLDWEYPDAREEIPGFERLTRRFRERLDELGARKGRRMLLTMAAGAHPKTLSWLDSEFLLANFDWVNLMTYDYAGSWTGFAGHNAPLRRSSRAPADYGQSVETTFDYLLNERGLPPRRLALGLPLYGRAFSVPRPYEKTEGTDGPGRSVVARDAAELLSEGWRREWDDETQTPWLIAPAGDAVLSYDDEESLRLKTAWARRQGLRGVFFWEVSQDRTEDGAHPLQNAAKAAWSGD